MSIITNWERHWNSQHPRLAKKKRLPLAAGQLPRHPYWAEQQRHASMRQVPIQQVSENQFRVIAFYRERGLRLRHEFLEAAAFQWKHRELPHPYSKEAKFY